MTTIGSVPWTLKAMIAGIDFAMLTTHFGNGRLHSRPLMTQDMDENEDLWFFDYRDTPTSLDIPDNPHINLSYGDPHHGYISVDGHAELVLDRVRMRSRWSPVHYHWFAQGLNDPSLTLVRITVDQAVSWPIPLMRHGRKLPSAASMAINDRNALGWETSPFP